MSWKRWFNRTRLKATTVAAGCTLSLVVASGCAPATLGHGGNGPRFTEMQAKLRAGFDDKKSVLAALGPPQQQLTDGQGREIFVYVWADGRGDGEHCVVAFNTSGVVYLVDASR